MKKFIVLIVILLSLSGAIYAAGSNVISEIKIQGTTVIDEDLIRSVITFKIGEFIDQNEVSKSIRNLYQLGVFDNINISADETDLGIGIVITVKEYPVIKKTKIKGNKKYSKDKIENEAGFVEGAYWSPFLKAEITKEVKKHYRDLSYHYAEVEFEIEENEDNTVNILLQVNEGQKVKIKKVSINGNKLVTAKELIKKMKTKKSSLFRSGKFKEEDFNEDLEKIIAYYNKKGFIDARIISHNKEIEGKHMFIEINLFEGQQFKFGKLEITGNERFITDVLMEKFTFEKGDIFDLGQFDMELQSLSEMYYEDGYIYSSFDHIIEKNGDFINIIIEVRENTRAKIHKIHIAGNRKTKEKVIRRQITLSPGEYYKQSKVIQSLRNVYNLGFFEADLHHTPEPINSNGDIDLTFHLNDKPSGTANGGIGYNSQDSFVGMLSMSMNNLLGNAWSSSFSWEFGGSTQDFELDFTNPYVYDTNILAGLSLHHTKKEWDSFNYNVLTSGGSVRVGKHLESLNFSKLIFSYSLTSKKYELQDDDDDASSYLLELTEKGYQHNSSVSVTFSRDSRDNYFFATGGTQLTLYNEIAGGALQGDFDYYKAIGEFRWYVPTFWKLVLRSKLRMGYATAFGSSEEVPPEERFYLGGTGSDGIRGYADRSIGPQDGGIREILFSTEYAFPIAPETVIGLLFFDSGNSYNNFEEFNLWELKKGAGAGVRIKTPLGLIGFDLARNFEDKSWEPHFQFGTTF